MIEKARQHNIQILCLPPNTTHILDVSYFKSLNVKWDSICEGFARENLGKFLTQCLGGDNKKKQVVVNGFSMIGISPSDNKQDSKSSQHESPKAFSSRYPDQGYI